MKQIIFLSVTLFSIIIARADISVEMDAKAPNSTNLLMSMVDKIKGNKVREDVFFEGGNIGSEILNLDTGENFKLLPDKKMVVKTPFNKSDLTNAIAVDAIKDTGKTETVNGYDAEIYTYTNSADKSYTLWIAKNFPNFETIKQDLVKRDRLHAWTQSGFSLSALPGMLLKFGNTTTNAGGYNPQFQVLINEKPIDDSVFELPKDYHFYSTNAPVANTNEIISATNEPPVK